MASLAFSRSIVRSLIIATVVSMMMFMLTSSTSAAGERKAITKNTTIGTLTVRAGNELVLQRGARLTVDTLTVEKEASVWCENGPLDITVRKQLVVAGTLKCFRTSLSKKDIGNAILLTFEKSASGVFADTAIVAANGHVQLVDHRGRLVNDSRVLATYRNAFAKDDGAPIGIGPLLPKNAKKPKVKPAKKQQVKFTGLECRDNNGNIVPNCLRIGGTWVVGPQGEEPPKRIEVPTPPKGIDRVILNYDFGGKDVEFQNDQEIIGPSGRPGDHDPKSGPARCTARGGDGGNAMDFKINARSVTFRNFLLKLGDGGRGGNATTPECEKAKATGGKGGQAGNMNVRAIAAIRVLGQLTIIPGRGGNGGEAKAYGKKGGAGMTPPKQCVGGPGGTANAVGGNGADNIRELRARGVEGLQKITVWPLYGGDGGSALARGGDGGDGITKGGPGGSAKANGGKGGAAKFILQGVSQPSSVDVPGKGGSAVSSDGIEGKASGESCEKKPVIDDTPTPPKNDITSLHFEFVDYTSGATTDAPPVRGESGFEVIIASRGTPDVRTYLPIRFVVLVDGAVKQERTISSSIQDCRGADGCSIYQPSLGDLTGKKVEVQAYDSNGQRIGSYAP